MSDKADTIIGVVSTIGFVVGWGIVLVERATGACILGSCVF